MDCTYGVGITNRFAVFIDGEQDETELIKEQEKVVEKKKAEKTKSAEKENKTKVTTKTKIVSAKKVIKEPTPTKISDNQAPKKDVENNKPRTNMGPRGAGNQNDRSSRFGSGNRFNDTNGPDSRDMEEKKNRKNKEVGDFRGDNEGRRGGIGGGRGGPGGMRGGRGRGRGRGGFDFRGKREYDRQSGSDRSGVKAVDKRDGAGSHNWGTMKDDLEEQLNATRTSEDNQDWAEKSGDDNPTTETKEIENETVTDEPKEPVEEEPLEMTLDEYKRQQAAARMVPKYNLRKAGEGEDDAMWKKTFRLEKKKTEEDDEEETDEEEEDEVIRRGRAKQTVNIDIQFSDSRHGQRGGRGGRGAGGGRGGSRGTDRPFRGRGGGGGNPGFRGGGGGGNTGFRGGDGSNTGFRGDGSSTGFRGDGSSTGFRGDGSSTGFRGAGRGGGTRTMPNAPNMLDENDFPSLT